MERYPEYSLWQGSFYKYPEEMYRARSKRFKRDGDMHWALAFMMKVITIMVKQRNATMKQSGTKRK